MREESEKMGSETLGRQQMPEKWKKLTKMTHFYVSASM